MSPPRVVSFDCAQTLVDVDWVVERFAVESAEAVGLLFADRESAMASYRACLVPRYAAILAANLTRDPDQVAAAWGTVAEEWLASLGVDPKWCEQIRLEADRRGFGPNSVLFRPYPDVEPCLSRLADAGIRIIVISNWDVSLHRVLRNFGWHHRFEFVLASLEEGVEKPDAGLFQIALAKAGVAPNEVVHVGDNPVDDVEGATAVGMRPVLIDRDRLYPDLPSIQTLDQLEATWNA